MNEDDSDKFFYSDKYYDDHYEYRHVIITKNKAKFVPKTHLMNENEWRSLGVKQSHGWQHYMIHEPEPHILLFRRALSTKPPSQLQQFQAEQLKS